MNVKLEYSHCVDMIDSNYPALYSTKEKERLYQTNKNKCRVFENIVYSSLSSSNIKFSEPNKNSNILVTDFLSSISIFSDFTLAQLCTLEFKSILTTFAPGAVVFKQGDAGDIFYVILSGSVDVFRQENPAYLRQGKLGEKVNSLGEGKYFGERALMTSERRDASIRVNNLTGAVSCLTFRCLTLP